MTETETGTAQPTTFDVRAYRRAIAAGNLLDPPLGLSDLARACGCSNTHLWGVLVGRRKPGAALVGRLALALGPAWPFVSGEATSLQDPAASERRAA